MTSNNNFFSKGSVMKSTKKYLSVAALAIALFASVQLSASEAPQPKTLKETPNIKK